MRRIASAVHRGACFAHSRGLANFQPPLIRGVLLAPGALVLIAVGVVARVGEGLGYGSIQRSQRKQRRDSECDCLAHDLSPFAGDTSLIVRVGAEDQSSSLTLVRLSGEFKTGIGDAASSVVLIWNGRPTIIRSRVVRRPIAGARATASPITAVL